MKRIYIITLLLLSSIFVTACGKNNYKELSYTELKSKIENKENFVLTLSAASCGNCEIFKGTITEINKKYKMTTYYIDIDKLNEEEKNELKKTFPYTGTPTTINIVEGDEKNPLSRIIGYSDYVAIKKKLINWNYIKE